MTTILYFYDNTFAHLRRRLAGMLHDSRMRLNGFVKRPTAVQSWSARALRCVFRLVRDYIPVMPTNSLSPNLMENLSK